MLVNVATLTSTRPVVRNVKRQRRRQIQQSRASSNFAWEWSVRSSRTRSRTLIAHPHQYTRSTVLVAHLPGPTASVLAPLILKLPDRTHPACLAPAHKWPRAAHAVRRRYDAPLHVFDAICLSEIAIMSILRLKKSKRTRLKYPIPIHECSDHVFLVLDPTLRARCPCA